MYRICPNYCGRFGSLIWDSIFNLLLIRSKRRYRLQPNCINKWVLGQFHRFWIYAGNVGTCHNDELVHVVRTAGIQMHCNRFGLQILPEGWPCCRSGKGQLNSSHANEDLDDGWMLTIVQANHDKRYFLEVAQLNDGRRYRQWPSASHLFTLRWNTHEESHRL